MEAKSAKADPVIAIFRPHAGKFAAFAIGVAAVIVTAPGSRAESVAEFYKGKQVRVVIGTRPGGSYGLYAQLASRHLGRFIPGNPAVAMESRPGAGGLVALNWFATAAPRDGTSLLIPLSSIVQEALFNKRANYDPLKIHYIGRLGVLKQVMVASKKSGLTSIAGANKRDFSVGAAGTYNITAHFPSIMRQLAGAKFRIITGYVGTGQTFLALERGEVDVASTSLDSLYARHWKQVQAGDILPLVVLSRARLREFPNTPIITEFGRTPAEKAFLNVFTVATEMGRSLAAPPDLPADRLAALRSAYEKMIADPEFQADARKAKLDVVPASGADLDKQIAEAMSMTPDVRAQAAKFYNSLSEGLEKKAK
ncbi:MAG: Bug family tripartite tricarboxylate transporter substrate binding protein [Beijerinckiaceae bacterium]